MAVVTNPCPRVTMFFSDAETGWSESHYDTEAGSLSQAVRNALINLVVPRQNLLAIGPFLKYVRASYDQYFRDAQVAFVPPPSVLTQGNNYPSAVVNNAEWGATRTWSSYEWNAVLARGVGGDYYRSLFYISGVPALDFADYQVPTGDPILWQACVAYSNALVNGQYGFPVWIRDPTVAPLKAVTAIGPAPTYPLTIPNHGIPNPPAPMSRIFLQKMGYTGTVKQKLDGPYKIVQIIDANTVQLAGFAFNPADVFSYGFAQYQTRGVAQYQSVIFERMTHRKRGRPFDSPRGRAKRAVITARG